VTDRRLAQLARIPVCELAGVGAKRSEALAAVGIETVLDLITHYPRRYVDRTREAAVADLKLGEEALILATVKRVQSRRTRNRRALVEADVFDGSAYLRMVFFNQGWRSNQLKAGVQAAFFGRLEAYGGRRQMTNPTVDLVGDRTGRVIPIYPQSQRVGLSTWELAAAVAEALERAGTLADPIEPERRQELNVIDRTSAFRKIHAPETMAAAQIARSRLVIDELLRLQLALVLRKRAYERDARGLRHVVDGDLLDRFVAGLGFELTGAQQRAIAEIKADLAGPHPMHRLLHGDVGAGKTLVAVAALLVAVQGGHQAALMAPTEVLAEQHGLGVRALVGDLSLDDASRLGGRRPLSVAVMTARTTATQRARILADLAGGAVDILIGTHALLEERVAFASLGVVVIDEQHRFGVEQRATLRDKGQDPDVLVMTATPIPRTAAMTVYGDLDVTVLDELPPGRTPIITLWVRSDIGAEDPQTALPVAGLTGDPYDRVAAEVAEGRQAYVVCSLVEDSPRIEARSATEEHLRLATEVWPNLRLGLLHGQLPSKEKEAVMADFRAGAIDVLVATTVVEVGVDVPNATVMIVQDADRFGMAQLHQLRGRVGRGAAKSWCFLLSGSSTPEAEARLGALERSSDGFELADVDLEIRGEGAVLGTRQKGRSDLKLASLRRDKEKVAQAREMAFAIVDADPGLARSSLLREELDLFLDREESDFLFKS